MASVYQSVGFTERIEASMARAFKLKDGERIAVIAPSGPQVADLWAFGLPTTTEYLSTEHTRSCLERLCPRVGEAFYSNMRRPMLRLAADHSPGDHDLLLSACDQARYDQLGYRYTHRNCKDNLLEVLDSEGLAINQVPSPVNLFERVVAGPNNELTIKAPRLKGGESVVLEALTDQIVAISACPMDIVPTNGEDRTPKPIEVQGQPTRSASDGGI